MIMAMARNAAYAEERAQLELLESQSAKCGDLDKRVRGLQMSLQRDSIKPMNDKTREHQIMIKNIDRIVTHIDKLLSSDDDKAGEEQIILAGPKKAGLDQYIACMRRIDQHLQQLASSKMKVQKKSVETFEAMLAEGVARVKELFASTLAGESHTVEPLNYLAKHNGEFPKLSQDKLSHLGAMQHAMSTPNARALTYNNRDNIAALVYADKRSPYLAGSLQVMSLATLSTSKRMNNDEPYRINTSAIGPYTKAMGGMFYAEYQNVHSIFSHEDIPSVLDATCQKAFGDMAKTLRELNQQIKSNIILDCFLGYEMIECVNKMSHRLSLETPDLKLPFTDALKPVRETAKASINELLEDQRRRINNMPTLPPDGAAIPITTETMTRLQMLTAFPKCLSSILGSTIGDGNWSSAASVHSTNSGSIRSFDVGADGSALLSRYVLETLDLHFTTLEARSRMAHKVKAISGVLLYNTVAVMDRMIRSSDLGSLLSNNQAAQAKMDGWRKKAVATYMDSWKEPSSALLDVTYINRTPSNRPASAASLPSADIVKNLNNKDKDAIKEKFKHFNSSFDEAVRRHKDLLPAMEREVRSGLAREINNMIEPLYMRFFDKYEAIDRGRGKYVRYDKGSVSAVLAALG